MKVRKKVDPAFKPYEIVITVESEQDEETLREISCAELRIPNALFYPMSGSFDSHPDDPKWERVHDFLLKLYQYFK